MQWQPDSVHQVDWHIWVGGRPTKVTYSGGQVTWKVWLAINCEDIRSLQNEKGQDYDCFRAYGQRQPQRYPLENWTWRRHDPQSLLSTVLGSESLSWKPYASQKYKYKVGTFCRGRIAQTQGV